MYSIKKSVSYFLASGAFFAAALLVSGCSQFYNGEKLFFTAGCSQCHTYKGRGGRMGPDLSGVTNIRGTDWIHRYLQDPKKMNPLARMPAFNHLSSSKRKAIIRFLSK